MDDRRFDSLTRVIAGTSRRRIIASTVAAAASALPILSARSAPSVAASRSDCEECRTRCRHGYVCLADNSCFCCSPSIEGGAAGAALLQTNDAGEIVAASAPGAPGSLGLELLVDRACGEDACTATMTIQEFGASAPTLVSTTELSSDTYRLRFVAEGLDYTIAADPVTASLESTSLTGPPRRGSFDPDTGQISGDFVCGETPMPFADTLASLEPALLAIAGRASPGSADAVCPPGEPVPAAINWCYTRCDIVWGAIGTGCCTGTMGFGCLLCGAGVVIAMNQCHGACDEARAHGGAMERPDETLAGVGAASPTPPRPTPAATPGSPRGAETAGAAADGTASEGTTSAGSDCAAGERRCGGRCVSAAECPAECCLNPNSCQCVCLDCLPEFVADPETCTCVCSPGPCAPGSNWQFDRESCSCVCIPPTSCPPNFVFNEESCSCVCPLTECSPNHVWDLEACTCTCVPQECPPNHVFDEALCDCVCGIDSCPPNYVFDAAGCACHCAAECPPNYVFDEATCSCICELTGCPPNLTFTPESCACYCEPPACPPGYFVDQASCTCFCPEAACPEGQIFDLARCACVGSGAGSAVGESG